MWSKLSLYLSITLITIISFFYYPKHNKQGSEATISWDVSGYYMYLPAFFIYQDAKQCGFKDSVLATYQPTPDWQQAFRHPKGNYIFKYSIGQAIMMSPGFFMGHMVASASDDKKDGFSWPYQYSIFFWGYLMTIMGIIMVWKVLSYYFDDISVAITLWIVIFGSNFLEYGAITNSMTHNYLFTCYAFLIYASHHFYKSYAWKYGISIGILVGLMALTRPTEIIAVLIPLLWCCGTQTPDIFNRIRVLVSQYPKLITAGLITGCIGFIQLLYWKYAGDEWLIYSYEDQGFSWMKPHLWDCLFSGRAGWFTYSPLMALSIIGLPLLYKNEKSVFLGVFVFTGVICYVTFAWDIWWYGGSVGQRSMVQGYPILAFTIATTAQWAFHKKFTTILISVLSSLGIIYNVWVTFAAHTGGTLFAGEMTSQYLAEIAFKKEKSSESIKLLDAQDIYSQPITMQKDIPVQGFLGPVCLRDTIQFSPKATMNLSYSDGWLRISATCHPKTFEWETWRMTQMIVKLYKGDDLVKTDMLRIQRCLKPDQSGIVYLDTKIESRVDHAEIYFWHADSPSEICIEKLACVWHQ